MTKVIITALLKISALGVISYYFYSDYGWGEALAAFTVIVSVFYIIELQQLQLEKQQKIANFLDYQFGEGYIDEENKLHKKGESVVDLSNEKYD